MRADVGAFRIFSEKMLAVVLAMLLAVGFVPVVPQAYAAEGENGASQDVVQLQPVETGNNGSAEGPQVLTLGGGGDQSSGSDDSEWGSGEVVAQTVVSSDGPNDNDALFESYAEKYLEDQLPQADGKRDMRIQYKTNLSGAGAFIYNSLADMARTAANANVPTATVITIGESESLSSVFSTTSWTAKDLNVDSVADSSGGSSQQAAKAALRKMQEEANFDTVIGQLMADCPYELYWYDKVYDKATKQGGTSFAASFGHSFINGVDTLVVSKVEISMTVAHEYRAQENNPFLVSSDRMQEVKDAADNAKAIVSQFKSLSTYERLLAYKNKICDLTLYNGDAITDNVAYGDPWQLIYVFDGDKKTNVVCEGYAKAFQYLCDLSGFSDITSHLVTGTMTGATGADRHMWNIVNMEDGKNYLVDVTNCDDGTVGAHSNALFLTAREKAGDGVDTQYSFNVFSHIVTYVYDEETRALYSDAELQLADEPYKANPAVSLASAKVALKSANGVYAPGKTHTPVVSSVVLGSTKLREGVDYYVVQPNGRVKAGTYTVKVVGKGRYTGTATATYRITPASLGSASISGYSNKAYTGSAITQNPTVKVGSTTLKNGTDYTVSYKNNVNVGTATMTITGKGNYTGSKSVTFKITGKAISGASVSGIAAQYYTGKAITPKPTVKYGSATLKLNTDYTLSYRNNKNRGTATVVITGKGNYTGSKSVTFKIIARPSWSGATSMPVNSTAAYTVRDGSIRVVSGGTVIGVSGRTVTAKRAGSAVLGLYDSAGRLYAKRTVSVYALSGNYVMQSSLSSRLVLDIEGVSRRDGARMIVWTRNGGANQKFRFVAQRDGTYAIRCAHSGKYVDVDGASKANGRQVIQWRWNGGNNQRWRITVDANNRLTFVSKNSGKCFDINGARAVKGQNMIQWPSNNGLNQKWVLKRS